MQVPARILNIVTYYDREINIFVKGVERDINNDRFMRDFVVV